MKQIRLNGQEHQSDKSNVFELLTELGLTTGRFAVEIDGYLVPKAKLSDIELTSGMIIEVVQAVGGG
ncbi:MAG: sulfur carrier protein ThiS [Moraxella sp.]